MRNRFVKFACICTMLALALTGCSLISIDPLMQADDDLAALKKDYSTVIAKYDGGEITKFDVTYDFTSQYSYYYYMYSMYGYTMDEAETKTLMEGIVKTYMNTYATINKAKELGIELTEEEIAECETAAQTSYQDAYDSVYETAEGDTEELKVKNTEITLYTQGITKEFFVNQQQWTKLIEKVEEVIKAEVSEISEEDLALKLTEQSIADEETYADDLGAFEKDMTDAAKCVTWMPNDYRTVKHILVKADEDVLAAVTDARTALSEAEDAMTKFNDELAAVSDDDSEDSRTADEINADIAAQETEVAAREADVKTAEDACIASVQDKLTEIYAKLDAGENFDSVMAEFGEDPGMQSDPAMTSGYYVSAESTNWDTNFRDAAMALEKVGDYAKQPVISTSGVHIVYYNSDVVGGQVSMDEIHDRFYDVALESAKTDHMNEEVAAWVAAMNPVYTTDKYFAE